ncbi:DUF3710 domain-containing protein [Sediminivirga luteola]|uniref:DUF3710 domain-containing protein n=2 Tax=Sediminivirga luteola TaxID=1774748 RepID=A0A8J2TWJ2_9MICO|nr:DUF3710 domain-containing protein [Sediminivirga luteola]GGA08230.1 hypothetical protein GCM10011333_08860 [Sediminivirga luteola]
MGLFDAFRRPKSTPPEQESKTADVADTVDAEELHEESDAEDTADADEEDADEELHAKSAPLDRREKGPFDSAEAPETTGEDGKKQPRLDLGALKLPVRHGMQVRLDVDDKTKRIMSVTVVSEKSTLQLQAFAAPRSEGLWNVVRGQLQESIAAQGGEARELHTEIGRELLAKIPATAKDGRKGFRLARFAGVDGPRWFLRAVIGGKALTDEEARAHIVSLLRGVVVDRGEEPLPPRELLPLTPPKQQTEGADGAQDAAEKGEDIDPFERGPEITEVR